MLRSITILLLILAASFAADEKPSREEFRVRARVQEVVILSSFSGTVTPVGVDLRYAVTLKIESVAPALPNLEPGDIVTFAVHSPALVFGPADPKGKTYDLMLRRVTANG